MLETQARGGMTVEYQGRFFRFIRDWARKLNIMQYQAPSRSEFVEPAVLVCRHSDNKGPVVTMLNLPLPVHPWSYHVWCDEAACRKQCEEYTFSIRYGWSARKSKFCAWLIAKPFTGLIRSAGSIPVYRNSLKVRETFRESIEALKRGESLLIFPDVNYTAQEGDAGALYEGFLLLEKLYFRETGKHLPFIPMHVSDHSKKLALARPLLFRDGAPFREEQKRIIQALHDSMNAMMEQYGS